MKQANALFFILFCWAATIHFQAMTKQSTKDETINIPKMKQLMLNSIVEIEEAAVPNLHHLGSVGPNCASSLGEFQ